MVRSEGKSTPNLLNSHLMAETPVWANGSASRRILVERINALRSSLVWLGLRKGALDLSLYQSKSPVRKRPSHLKNQYFERFRSLQISSGDSPLRYLKMAFFLISSSICNPPCGHLPRRYHTRNGSQGYRCPDTIFEIKSYRCLGTSGLSMSWHLSLSS